MIKNKVISNGDTITHCKGNIMSDMDGEKVMLSIENGKYYNLGDIGGHIWELIGVPITVNHLISTLSSEYEVDDKECEEQVTTFLEHLLEENLLQIVGKVNF